MHCFEIQNQQVSVLLKVFSEKDQIFFEQFKYFYILLHKIELGSCTTTRFRIVCINDFVVRSVNGSYIGCAN